MIENQAITYSLLAQIRNSGSLIKGPLDIFVPLIKRVLYKLSQENLTKSNSINPIQQKAKQLYNIDFPTPVIRNILSKICIELNTPEHQVLQLHSDGSYILSNFIFEDFEEKIQNSKTEIEKIEKLFIEFCKINNIEIRNRTSIFDFIDKNRYTLGKYFASQSAISGIDYTIEAKFVDYFKMSSQVYDVIRKIYLGSILTCYIQFKTEQLKLDVELLFDTNFIVSLIDLNTEESTHTCNRLLEVCKTLGYKFSILIDTIKETKALIQTKATFFNQTFLQKRINPEDIYNACERRKLSIADLERIVDNLENIISSKGINTIYDTTKYKNQAKFSNEYINLKEVRNTKTAALHDATALCYVRAKRERKIVEFDKVNCWFVNNSISQDSTYFKEVNPSSISFQPEVIKADELLNILWLSNPQVNSAISDNDLVDIGLSSIVAFTLNDSLPKAQIIRELDENITKYGQETLTSRDIVNISTRIVNRQLKDLQQLNDIANEDSAKFISKLQEEAEKQQDEERKRLDKFQSLFENLENHQGKLDLKIKEVTDTSEKSKAVISELEANIQKTINDKNEYLAVEERKKNVRIENYKNLQVKKWRRSSWNELIVSMILIFIFCLYIFYKSNFQLSKTMDIIKESQANIFFAFFLAILPIIFSVYIINGLFYKYRNHSNIDAYKRNIKIPDEI